VKTQSGFVIDTYVIAAFCVECASTDASKSASAGIPALRSENAYLASPALTQQVPSK